MRRQIPTALYFGLAAALLAALVPLAALARPALTEGRGAKDLFLHISRAEALRNGVPFALLDAVIAVESGYDPLARGGAGEVGLMQVLPTTAALMGFTGSLATLAEPPTNIAYGARYLAEAWRLAGGDVCTTVMKYRAGHGETRFSARSVDYCSRVRAHLERAGSPIVLSRTSTQFVKATAETASRTQDGTSRTAACFRRVVQPGRRFGACIPRSVLAKKGLLR